ncbi:MAG: hypothetical protein WCL46_09415 [Chlorobium sp.]
MKKAFDLFGYALQKQDKKNFSVKEIAERMTPVNEDTLMLPYTFAHNLRKIVQDSRRCVDVVNYNNDQEVFVH